jgi:hypothetical protein
MCATFAGFAMKQIRCLVVAMGVTTRDAKRGNANMTLTTTIQGLIAGERPTVMVPPASDGPFQGWGTRIG